MFKLRHPAPAGNKGRISALAAALAVIASLSNPAQAGGGPWTIVSVEGDAKLIVGAGAAQQPEPGQPVTAGVAIATGADGTVVLARSGDSINVTPNSRMSVPAGVGGEEPGILQSLGKLLFRMESRESRDFEVTTPYLAAAIKGTTFTVEVEDGAAAVNVSEGVVQVTALASGDMALVGAGERAEVDRDGPDTVQVGAASDDAQKEQANEAEETVEGSVSTGSDEPDGTATGGENTSGGSDTGSNKDPDGSDSQGDPGDDGASSPGNSKKEE